MLKWPFQIWTLLEHVKQKRSQQGYMQQQYAPPMYPPQGVNGTGVNNASTKNDTPLIIEVILSLFGIYGIGWLMAGETTTGVILLICSFVVYWPLLVLIAVFTFGFGLACDFPLAIAAIIINAVLLNKTLAKKPSQEVSSRSSRAKEFRSGVQEQKNLGNDSMRG